jgi:hypothetical protein
MYVCTYVYAHIQTRTHILTDNDRNVSLNTHPHGPHRITSHHITSHHITSHRLIWEAERRSAAGSRAGLGPQLLLRALLAGKLSASAAG